MIFGVWSVAFLLWLMGHGYPARRGSAMGDKASTSGSGAAPGYIDHTVSRLDTLAGVAIKYGVEVADVKRFNGLTTDLQMFALKTLRIPTPGRHPPAALATPSSRSEDLTPISGKHEKSATMELLRDYYGLPASEMTDEEVFVPMFRPPNATVAERCSYDMKPNRCGYVRESCNNLLDSCWSAHEPSRVLRSTGKKVVGDSQSKESLPIRRRTRSDLDLSERVNFPTKAPPRPLKDSTSRFADDGAGIKSSIGAAVEGLLSKVMPQELQMSERVPSFSALEGITSAYRHAKAALD